jgi:NAD(P)-dependent dehydrogenase (short-subunit alcohol dehydrogenase family)
MAVGADSLANKHVVVIGGTSGIGRAVATAASAAGSRLTIASRSSDKIKQTLGLLRADASGATVGLHGSTVRRRVLPTGGNNR